MAGGATNVRTILTPATVSQYRVAPPPLPRKLTISRGRSSFSWDRVDYIRPHVGDTKVTHISSVLREECHTISIALKESTTCEKVQDIILRLMEQCLGAQPRLLNLWPVVSY